MRRKVARPEAALRLYAASERMLSPVELAHVMDKSIEVGMTECGVFAARGMPNAANHTTTSAGTSLQLVYSGSRLYVYTEESRLFSVKVVRSFQH